MLSGKESINPQFYNGWRKRVARITTNCNRLRFDVLQRYTVARPTGGHGSGMVFDLDYLTRLREKDPETERHFVTHFSTVIYFRLRNKLKSKEMIPDIRQETFYRVMRFIHSGKHFEHPEHLGAFVQTTCQNVTLEFLRGDARHPQQSEPTPDLPDTQLDIEEGLVTEDRKKAILSVLSQLPKKDQKILRLLFLEETPREEVCRQFDVESDYLRVLLHRAKARFRAVLDGAKVRSAHFLTIIIL